MNLGNSAVANDSLLHHLLNTQTCDILLLQEPYTVRSRLTGLDTALFRCLLSKGIIKPGSTNVIHGSAIVNVKNPHLIVLWRKDLCTANNSVATIEINNTFRINIVSSYFKYRYPTGTYVNQLKNIIERLDGNIIIGADVNAASTIWHSTRINTKGDIVEQFMADNNLFCHNRPNNPHTFRGPRGISNIDITLSSLSLADLIQNWSVIPDAVQSDHRAITFDLIHGQTRIRLLLLLLLAY